MKMAFNYAILSLCLIISFSSTLASSKPTEANFVQCFLNLLNSARPISEVIYNQSSPSFTKALGSSIRNRRFMTPTTPKPLYIVIPSHAFHAQATALCAPKNGLQIRVRSGGHDYEGLSYVSNVPFVLLDLANMNSIHINLKDETAYVEAGATTGELYYKIQEKSKVHAFPAGVGLSLGTGGHFSGGGYGPMIRKFGLSVDHVIDAQLVDVNGKILDRKAMGEDVFWALRGGGGASFGVILSWKIKLVRIPEIVTVFNINRTLEQNAVDILYKWQLVSTKFPKELFLRAMPIVANGTKPGEKFVSVRFIALFLGQPNQLLSILKASFPELGVVENDCIPTSWVNSTLFWENKPIGTPLEDALLKRPIGADYFFKSKCDYVENPFEKRTIEAMLKKLAKIKNGWIQLNPMGGKMDEIPETDAPYAYRKGNVFFMQYYSRWTEEKDSKPIIKGLRDLYEFMTPFVSTQPRKAYLNYRDLDIGANPSNVTDRAIAEDYGFKFFLGNFDRLKRAKTKVDPTNFFRNEQSIPSMYSD